MIILLFYYPPPCPQGTRGVFLMRKLGSFPRYCWVAFPGTALRDPLRAKSRRIADFLSSFKGPHGPLSELLGISCMKIIHLFFGSFSILHFFTFLCQNPPRKLQKVSKIVKIHEKTPSRSSFEFVPPKRIPKV